MQPELLAAAEAILFASGDAISLEELGSALELYPQIYPALLSQGLCCVNEENEGLSLGELARSLGREPEGFIEALNAAAGC